VHWLAVIIEDPDRRWLLRRVGAGPILKGLWLPPFTEIAPSRALEDQARKLAPFEIESPLEFLEPIMHSITHRRIEVTPVRVRVGRIVGAADGWSWADPARPNLPTSSLLGKLLKSISS